MAVGITPVKLSRSYRPSSLHQIRQRYDFWQAFSFTPKARAHGLTAQIVFFGANDASLPDAPNKQHVPLGEFKGNIEAIITHPQIRAHAPRIILVAPPPINEHLWWPRDQSSGYSSVSRLASTTKEYSDAVVELGADLKLPVVNLWKAFMAKTDFKVDGCKLGDALPGSLDAPQNDALVELMYDGKLRPLKTLDGSNADCVRGLHFNPAGYDIFYQELMKLIAELWPDQMPEKLPMVLPPWNDHDAWKTWEETQTITK
jgi:lysophospholipase L1-like esterase